MMSTHDRIMIPCIFLNTLTDMWTNPENPNYTNVHESDVILINEGQFFTDIFDIVLDIVEVSKKKVFITGLDGDFRRQLFGDLLRLIPFCDKVNKCQALCALCKDGTPAIHSLRIVENDAQVLIGSSDIYKPVCRECYINHEK